MDVALLSQNRTWAIAQAQFTNPMYLQWELGRTDNKLDTGFDISTGSTIAISFEGTYSGQAVTHQQTQDPTGASGWFNVLGSPSDGSTATATGSTSGLTYVFPTLGTRHRIKVTTLGAGTLEARARLDGMVLTSSLAGGGGGGGGGIVQATATAVAPSYVEGTNNNLSMDLSGDLRTVDSAAVALLTTINSGINTPATFLPPIPATNINASIYTRTSIVMTTLTTAQNLRAAVVGQKTSIYRLFLTITGQASNAVLTFKSGATTLMTFGAISDAVGQSRMISAPEPWLANTANNEALTLESTVSCEVRGMILSIAAA